MELTKRANYTTTFHCRSKRNERGSLWDLGEVEQAAVVQRCFQRRVPVLLYSLESMSVPYRLHPPLPSALESSSLPRTQRRRYHERDDDRKSTLNFKAVLPGVRFDKSRDLFSSGGNEETKNGKQGTACSQSLRAESSPHLASALVATFPSAMVSTLEQCKVRLRSDASIRSRPQHLAASRSAVLRAQIPDPEDLIKSTLFLFHGNPGHS